MLSVRHPPSTILTSLTRFQRHHPTRLLPRPQHPALPLPDQPYLPRPPAPLPRPTHHPHTPLRLRRPDLQNPTTATPITRHGAQRHVLHAAGLLPWPSCALRSRPRLGLSPLRYDGLPQLHHQAALCRAITTPPPTPVSHLQGPTIVGTDARPWCQPQSLSLPLIRTSLHSPCLRQHAVLLRRR